MLVQKHDLLSHIDPLNDSILEIVLKGHLVVEGAIDDILRKHFLNERYYDDARLSFFQKLNLVRARHWREHDNNIWHLVKCLNELRNSFAHRLDTQHQNEKLDKVLKYQIEIESDHKEKNSLVNSDPRMQLLLAFALVSGFLSGYLKDAEFLGSLSSDLHASFERMRKKTEQDAAANP